MKKSFSRILVLITILIIIFMSFINSYNSLVGLDQRVKAAESDIDTQLQRRSDLIPNLVETVKGYASQERGIFTDIANARSNLAGARNIEQTANADGQLTSAISRLLLVVENYPELKSNQNFRDLTVTLEGTENRITIARQNYNESVDAYNTRTRRFPASMTAGMFGFHERPYYKASTGAGEVPKVDFSK